MKTEDFSNTRMMARPDRTDFPSVTEDRLGSCGDESTGNAQSESYAHLLTPPPAWPRVFPGL
jgi:hypothetical protein